ncbi:MAG: DNA-binding protein [Pyrobaculum sp.]
MSDDIDALLRKKALELAKSRTERPIQQKKLTDEEAVRIVKTITYGDKAGEIIEKALELYKPHIYTIFRKIAELHQQGVIKELADYELYEVLKNAGFKVPISTEIKIVRHGREYKIGES